jgi:hypothetical protein
MIPDCRATLANRINLLCQRFERVDTIQPCSEKSRTISSCHRTLVIDCLIFKGVAVESTAKPDPVKSVRNFHGS